MSKINISDFVNAGRQALISGQYWSALAVALTLPSVCAKATDFINNEEKAYKEWCNENLEFVSANNNPELIVFSSGDAAGILFELWKSFIQEPGLDEFYFTKGFKKCHFPDRRIVNIAVLCRTIFDDVDKWLKKEHEFSLPQADCLDLREKTDREYIQKLRSEDKIKEISTPFPMISSTFKTIKKDVSVHFIAEVV